MKILELLFREKYLEWNEYMDVARERTFFADKHLLKEKRWDYVL